MWGLGTLSPAHKIVRSDVGQPVHVIRRLVPRSRDPIVPTSRHPGHAPSSSLPSSTASARCASQMAALSIRRSLAFGARRGKESRNKRSRIAANAFAFLATDGRGPLPSATLMGLVDGETDTPPRRESHSRGGYICVSASGSAAKQLERRESRRFKKREERAVRLWCSRR